LGVNGLSGVGGVGGVGVGGGVGKEVLEVSIMVLVILMNNPTRPHTFILTKKPFHYLCPFWYSAHNVI
jgi:hypothetical protein